MKRSEEERLSLVSKLLIDNKTYISIDEMANMIGVSRRNVYYAVDSINKTLENKGLEKIHKVYGKGLFLDDKQKNCISEAFSRTDVFDIASLSSDERIACLFCEILISKKVCTIDVFCDLLKISRYTVISDINSLKEIMIQYGLCLQFDGGYRIEGSEENRRKLFMAMFSVIYTVLEMHPEGFRVFSFQGTEIAQTFQKLIKLKDDEHTYYDCSMYAIAVLLCYVKKGLNLQLETELPSTFHSEVYAEERSFIGNEFPFLSENEELYFACYLSCSQIGSTGKAQNDQMIDVANRMVQIYYMLTAIKIEDDEFVHRLASHIELAYQRYQLGIAIDNPLLEQIKKKYGSYYDIVKQATLPIEERINGPLSENEIGFLTLYFVGQTEKEKKNLPKVRTVIICLNGLSTSYLLKNELENLDSRIEVITTIGLSEYMRNSYPCDLVVSTVPFTPKPGDKGITVHAILTFEDRVVISNILNKIVFATNGIPSFSKILDIVKPFVGRERINEVSASLKMLYDTSNSIPEVRTDFSEVFCPEFAMISDSDDDWVGLLNKAAEPLVEADYIGEDYVREMVDNINQYGNYMVFNNGYFLGHASARMSKKLGLAILRLNEWATIGDAQVKTIMILTPVNYTSHLGLVYKLLDLFNDEETTNLIQSTNDPKLLYSTIRKQII